MLLLAASEGSKTLFYVFGGLLVAWAALVSAVGIMRHETFPGSLGVRRGVMLVTVVLVAAAMATAVLTA